MKYIAKADTNINLPAMETEIIAYWKRFNLAQRATDKAHKCEFVFYDGPPFANGLPHYGHLLTGYAKDLIARFRTMLEESVERRFGWDCHGLPAEMAAEKELGLSGGAKAIEEDYGVAKFNEYCESSVMKYASLWQQYVERQGRWVSFENDYKTMDVTYMESVIWAFKQLHNKGLIYQDYRVMPYSWACETPLSNFEIRLDDSYREKVSKTVTVAFKLKEPLIGFDTRLLAWTTTPWTLPSNLALAVNPELDYEYVIVGGICYVGKNIDALMLDLCRLHGDIQSRGVVGGSILVGLEYYPLFPYFQHASNGFRILGADFVTASDGTGIVHMAPGFGEDDFTLCRRHNIPVVCPIDSAGVFTDEVGDLAGKFVFDSNDLIINKLKSQGSWVKTDQYVHNYPHCWRTDTPLIYRAMPSWYVEVSRFSERMAELSEQIEWVPEYSKAQFTQWLKNATDWSISRNRFFGTPIPVWQSSDARYPRIDVYGSIAELERDFCVKITNLHRQYLDTLERPNPDDPTGKSVMRRVPEVLDCWFESGSMPFASFHYPFNQYDAVAIYNNNKPTNLPADFIVEYVAQIRGWFYTLMVLSTALFDSIPFRNAICHGVVLDADGRKLSKRLGNYADPAVVMDKYSSDALRFLMMSSPVMSGGTLYIDKECKLVSDVVRLHIKPIWNAYVFLITYANIDSAQMKQYVPSGNDFDRYIYIKLCMAVSEIKKSLSEYKIDSAYKALSNLFEDLDNWYIRRNKKRLWKSGCDNDKQRAFDTLYTVLNNATLAMAPLLPFLAEAIYAGLNHGGDYVDPENSVHMQSFPNLDITLSHSDMALLNNMELTRKICNAALAVRSKNKLRVRQPLSRLVITCDMPEGIDINTIKDEVNVKEVVFDANISKYCAVEPKINFPVVGKRMPDKVKSVMKSMHDWRMLDGGQVQFGGYILQPDEVALRVTPLSPASTEVVGGLLAVILDTSITPDLWKEGVVRDVVRSVQMARQGLFEISDRILIYMSIEDAAVRSACEEWRDYIAEQTLAAELYFAQLPDGWVTMRFDIEEKPVLLGMKRLAH